MLASKPLGLKPVWSVPLRKQSSSADVTKLHQNLLSRDDIILQHELPAGQRSCDAHGCNFRLNIGALLKGTTRAAIRDLPREPNTP